MWVIAKPKSKTQFVSECSLDYVDIASAKKYDSEQKAKEAIREKGELVYEVERVYKLKKV